MKYINQVTRVTLWEYKRFYKPKNELLGIVIMLMVSAASYFITKQAMSDSGEKHKLTVVYGTDSQLIGMLAANFEIDSVAVTEQEATKSDITLKKDGILLLNNENGFAIHAYKKSKKTKLLIELLNSYSRSQAMQEVGLSLETLNYIDTPAIVAESFIYSENSRSRSIMAIFFAGLMIMAVFLSFAYQFTAITGEKQLKITEQIVSAISPQVWIDGKIFGISLTGISSMLTYSLLGIIGGVIYFQFTGVPVSNILNFLHLPSILLYLPFALTGILLWNAILAAIASVITDPNNSGKISLMMLPALFVLSSFFVTRDPDSNLAVFLSWFPLTSASAMPMRWALTEVGFLQLAGSFILLLATFYLLRKLAAKIFRVSILISGKEPTWREIYRLSKES